MTEATQYETADEHRFEAARTIIRKAWFKLNAESVIEKEAGELLIEACALLQEAKLTFRKQEVVATFNHSSSMLEVSIDKYSVMIMLNLRVLQEYDGGEAAVWDEETASFKPKDESLEFAVQGVLAVALDKLRAKVTRLRG